MSNITELDWYTLIKASIRGLYQSLWSPLSAYLPQSIQLPHALEVLIKTRYSLDASTICLNLFDLSIETKTSIVETTLYQIIDMSYVNHSPERKCDSVFISLVVSISIPMIYRYNKRLELTQHARISDVESSKQNTSKFNCNNKTKEFHCCFHNHSEIYFK